MNAPVLGLFRAADANCSPALLSHAYCLAHLNAYGCFCVSSGAKYVVGVGYTDLAPATCRTELDWHEDGGWADVDPSAANPRHKLAKNVESYQETLLLQSAI